MNRGKAIYNGKAKIIYEGPEKGTLVQYFKDDETESDKAKASINAGKGVLNNRISAHIMTKLESIGIPTHFIRSLNMREQLVRQVEMIPLEVNVHNTASGKICDRLGVKENFLFPQPLIEFNYKKGDNEKPLVSEQHIFAFDWADPYELEEMVLQSLRVNDFLSGLFSVIGLRLTNFKLEYGRLWGEDDELYIMLADEISLDNCRLSYVETGKEFQTDKTELQDMLENYQEIAKRLGLIPESGIIQNGMFDEGAAEDLNKIENNLILHRNLRSVKKVPKR